jgi:HSP20 family protein
VLPVARRSNWFGSPFDEQFGRLRNEVDGIFDRFFGSDGGSQTPAWTAVPIAMWQDQDHLYIEAELAGLTENDVEVTVHNGMLFIRGERKLPEGRSYLYNTRAYGRFERVLALPDTIDPDHVEAKLSAGVLQVVLNKSTKAKPKKIAVQTA